MELSQNEDVMCKIPSADTARGQPKFLCHKPRGHDTRHCNIPQRTDGLRLAVLILHGPQLGRTWRLIIASQATPHPYLIGFTQPVLIRIGQHGFFSTIRHYRTKPTWQKHLQQGCPNDSHKCHYQTQQIFVQNVVFNCGSSWSVILNHHSVWSYFHFLISRM
jgi:hypothetical protein